MKRLLPLMVMAAAACSDGSSDGGILTRIAGNASQSQCPHGGVLMNFGTDEDGNGLLTSGEVTDSYSVCNAEGHDCIVNDNFNGSANVSCNATGRGGCTVANNDNGTATVTCADGTSATYQNDPCSVTDNEDGTVTLTCPDGTTTTLGSGTGESDCTLLANGDGTYELACDPGPIEIPPDERFSGDFTVWTAEDLTRLEGYREVSGNFSIQSPSLSRVFLPNIERVGGNLTIKETYVLSGLHLNNLIEVGGDVLIELNDSIENLTGLPRLSRVAGKIEIHDNAKLDSMRGLGNLTEVGGNIIIDDNDQLTEIELGRLQGAGANLIIQNNRRLPHLIGLGRLTNIEGTLTIENNQAVEDLSGLGAITRIGADLNIRENDALVRIDALGTLTELGAGPQIKDNALLPTCAAEALAERLELVGTPSISGNDDEATCE